MNKTTNYQLNQWERADRVLMDDFNADNAKIDAAIEAVRQLTLLSRFTKLWERTLTSSSSEITIPMTGIDWSKWDKVHLDVQISNSAQMYLYLNSTNSYKLSLYGETDYFMARITFHVGNIADRYIHLNKADEWINTNILFSGLKKLIITGNTMHKDNQFILWGEE